MSPGKDWLDYLVDNIWDKYDVDKNGELEMEEAKMLFDDSLQQIGMHEHVGDCEKFVQEFKEFDTDGGGTIDKEEAKNYFRRYMAK